MSFADKLSLGLNTAVIGMGIVFLVLILLCFVIMIQSKLVSILFKKTDLGKNIPDHRQDIIVQDNIVVNKKGVTSGETLLIGVENEETVAVIMACVSLEANIALDQLKFNSIKAV